MVARRGIALVTALFAVILLFGFATAMLAQVRGDLALTRNLDQRARARALARSAVQAGLYELNRDPTWEVTHLDKPATRMLEGFELKFWVENTTNPGILRLRGTSRVGREEAENTMLVTRAGGPGGLLLEGGHELYQLGADGEWTVLPPGPQRLHNPVGGPQGEVYAWGDDRRTLFRYDPGPGLWTPLPRLPAFDEEPEEPGPNDDEGREPTNEPPADDARNGDSGDRHDHGPQFAGIAVDGNGQLYALVKKRVWFLDGTTWNPLPPLGDGDVRHLSADDAGHVWVVRNKRTPTRYDPALDRWQAVADHPDVSWTKNNGTLKLRAVEKPPELKSVAVDPQGNLYVAGPSHNDVLTLYRFVPGESDGAELPGTYHVLATVPNVKMRKQAGELVALEQGGQVKKADNLAVDGSGTVYFRQNRDDYDTLYQANITGSQASYGTLPGVPKVKRKDGEQVEKPGEFMKDVKRLGGGRAPSSGSPRYVPRYAE